MKVISTQQKTPLILRQNTWSGTNVAHRRVCRKFSDRGGYQSSGGHCCISITNRKKCFILNRFSDEIMSAIHQNLCAKKQHSTGYLIISNIFCWWTMSDKLLIYSNVSNTEISAAKVDGKHLCNSQIRAQIILHSGSNRNEQCKQWCVKASSYLSMNIGKFDAFCLGAGAYAPQPRVHSHYL